MTIIKNFSPNNDRFHVRRDGLHPAYYKLSGGGEWFHSEFWLTKENYYYRFLRFLIFFMGPSHLKSAHYFINASCPDRCRICLEVTVWSLWHVRHVAWFNLFLKILERQGIVYFWNTFDCISSLHSCGWKMWFSPRSGWASSLRCEWKIDLGLGLSVFRIPPFFADERTHGLGVKKPKYVRSLSELLLPGERDWNLHISVCNCSTVSVIGELDRKAFIIIIIILSFILYWGIVV